MPVLLLTSSISSRALAWQSSGGCLYTTVTTSLSASIFAGEKFLETSTSREGARGFGELKLIEDVVVGVVDASGMISNEEVEGRGEFLGLDNLSEEGLGLDEVSEAELVLGGSGAALFFEDLILVKESFDP